MTYLKSEKVRYGGTDIPINQRTRSLIEVEVILDSSLFQCIFPNIRGQQQGTTMLSKTFELRPLQITLSATISLNAYRSLDHLWLFFFDPFWLSINQGISGMFLWNTFHVSQDHCLFVRLSFQDYYPCLWMIIVKCIV